MDNKDGLYATSLPTWKVVIFYTSPHCLHGHLEAPNTLTQSGISRLINTYIVKNELVSFASNGFHEVTTKEIDTTQIKFIQKVVTLFGMVIGFDG
uniref:Uncharacterized protein n=1 Tax=Tanacetum cinerariifolium TaxID=118510 RepID=A0A6L2P5J5_TANCI|nr:hypothetical protein [Tanacetum cinerariifolium]